LLLHSTHSKFVQYEPEIFPGLIYRKYEAGKNITLLIFVSGKVVITGGKSLLDIKSAFRYILKFLNLYKKE
jgi:transcription initiation factor TFIID TATA-box-binding protein